jgi:nucleotide-binding universal stress UspA family protein
VKEFKKILFPVVFSKASEKIVPYVRMMAKEFEYQIHLLYVAKVFDYLQSIYVPQPSITQLEKETKEGAQRQLYEFIDEHFKSFPDTEATVITGDASEQIVNFVESKGIDLVIMGTHGRMGLDKVIFGSVAERVVKTARGPVLLINPYREPNISGRTDEKAEILEVVNQ